jgi:hypothetical protein
MKILKALVTGVEDGGISKCDAIEFDGKLWLVPRWLDFPAQGLTKPARLVRFDTLLHQETPSSPSPQEADYVLNQPIPGELLEIRTPKQPILGFEFLELPEVSFPLKASKDD